ncbi:hypothetical protein OUZ56_024261 [Daphnia magna]|uniref:Uncharacterized protein n=1 Tax=Daphnia magna TaxID=35525 RepID=A0ABR0B0G6_9CRUS|nr:hypothetical protein OUZ56_024261 [Daphnia magna]
MLGNGNHADQPLLVKSGPFCETVSPLAINALANFVIPCQRFIRTRVIEPLLKDGSDLTAMLFKAVNFLVMRTVLIAFRFSSTRGSVSKIYITVIFGTLQQEEEGVRETISP